MDVSVCIVNWNTKDLLYKCITSIKEKTTGLTYEIIVVDNDSSDGSADMIRTEFPECTLIESENVGFAKGNNKAVNKASGNYILYLNPDTELVTNAIYGMFLFLEQNNEYGAVGPRLINPDGTIQYECAGTFPTWSNLLFHLLFLNRVFPKSKILCSAELNYWNHQNSTSIDCISGASMMVRREIIDKIGGFDEGTFMYSEDIDMCYRILQNNWMIYYLYEEVIIHYQGSATNKKKNKSFSSIMMKQSNYYFINKHFGQTKALQYKLIAGMGSLFRLFFVLFFSPLFMTKIYTHTNLSAYINKHINIFLWSVSAKSIAAPKKNR